MSVNWIGQPIMIPVNSVDFIIGLSDYGDMKLHQKRCFTFFLLNGISRNQKLIERRSYQRNFVVFLHNNCYYLENDFS